jgi:phosphoglycolate phosphatase-like HAD superfamily hydrolase
VASRLYETLQSGLDDCPRRRPFATMTMPARRSNLSRAVAFLLACYIAAALGCAAKPKAVPPTVTAAPSPPPDPLPSWSEGAAKRQLIDFVTRVAGDGPEHVPTEDRIAVFDNDGTLWQEKPLAEAAFAFSRLAKMANADPSLRDRQPYKAALEHDFAALHEQGEAAALRLLTVTHTGTTDAAYMADVRQFLATARHPRFHVPYTALVYAPMLELLRLLRANGFATYICSGGDVDFVRTFSESAYGIPPEHVIGSGFEKELVTVAGKTVLLRKPRIETLNDKGQKPIGIDRGIGRRPLFAAGNVRSGGDIAMLRYTRDRPGPSFALVINHDDDIRESAYAENDGATLAAAGVYDFTVVSMQRDWNVVFGPR